MAQAKLTQANIAAALQSFDVHEQYRPRSDSLTSSLSDMLRSLPSPNERSLPPGLLAFPFPPFEDIKYDPELSSENFRVDRRSVRELFEIGGLDVAETLFFNLMTSTNTFIHWRQDLSCAERPEDDPFIRIFGTPANTAKAKSMILLNFLNRGSPIKMCLTISAFDQFYFIGQRGAMGRTQARIHFAGPKGEEPTTSHKVIMYGDVQSLEEARDTLRAKVPFIMSFDMHFMCPLPDLNKIPFIKKVESRFNVQVIFFGTAVRNLYEVLVKGTEAEARKVKEAVMKISTSNLGLLITPEVRLQMPVSKDFLQILTRNDSAIIVKTMANTGTGIIMDESSELNGSIKLIISGAANDVHNAKRELVGFMPVKLIFEIADDCTFRIKTIEERFDIKLTVEPMKNLNLLCITIRGTELYIDNIYDAYYHVINLQWQGRNSIDSTDSGFASLPKCFNKEEAEHRALNPFW